MENVVLKAASQFGFEATSIESLTEGLIHQTYKATSATRNSIVLQQVNTGVFADPNIITENYQIIYRRLKENDGMRIPAILKTIKGDRVWLDEQGYCWRGFEYIENSYTEKLPATPEIIHNAAQCYGAFVHSLQGVPKENLKPTIVGFHDLNNRYNQFQHSIKSATQLRLSNSKTLLEKIKGRESLVDFYNDLIRNPKFEIRAMHHDCKLSNILFDKQTKKAICPIDLDTTMPGYFFSDVGDMIRSMVSSAGESDSVNAIQIKKESYKAIIDGYRSGIKNAFTDTEEKYTHHAGLLMIFMQGTRFLTDYLSNDVYYKITYAEQNFDRASNQIALLEKLEVFLKEEYDYNF